jgi:signal transduction histidine kinase
VSRQRLEWARARARLPRRAWAWLRGAAGAWLPQKVRTRLAFVYAAVFLAGGLILLGLTYGLVASKLPGSSPRDKENAVQLAKLEKECKQQPRYPPPKQQPSDPALRRQCSHAFGAGLAAGASSERSRALDTLLLYSLIGLGAMTVLSGGAGWLMAGRVLRPVRTITEAARQASQEHLGHRLALTGPRDELKELADTFDDMLERLDRAFASQRRFVADASHELRTPLTVMRTAIDVTLAKPGRTTGHLEAMAVKVRNSIGRAEALIDALLALATSERGPRQQDFADLATAAADALDAAKPGIEGRGLDVTTWLDPARTTGDPALLERMVANLVDNAVRHNHDGGWIRLRTGTEQAGAALYIANSGPFVPPDSVPGLFEPFRRLAGRTGAGDGAGLGLAIARSIATAHGGNIAASSRRDGGLEVSVTIPDPVAVPAAAGFR